VELIEALAAIPVLEHWTRERAEAWWETHLPVEAPVTELRPKTPLATMHTEKAPLSPAGSAPFVVSPRASEK